MHILITGGAGFLGSSLARYLVTRGLPGSSVERITLLDRAASAQPIQDPRVSYVEADINDPAALAGAIGPQTTIVHLAAVVSGQAEADFDLGMRVNVDATRLILERARALGTRPRLVFASSVAAFGGVLPAKVADDTRTLPQSSYGVQKVIGELLVGDYTRKGFIDGVTLRVPTISVRPGAPNKAASSFASGIVREPLAGVPAVCPVSEDVRLWLQSPGCAVSTLAHALTLDGAALGIDRTINLPGLSVSVREMLQALREVAGPDVVARVRFERDPAVERIVTSWPSDFTADRASDLGFVSDDDYASIVRAHMADHGMAASA